MLIGEPQNEKRIRGIGSLTHIMSDLFFGCDYQRERILAAAAKSFQSCLTLCNPIDGSPPGSPVPGILQARTLECLAISFSNVGK